MVRADIMTESGGRSKGCGTVLFETPEDAAHAISILCCGNLSEQGSWLSKLFNVQRQLIKRLHSLPSSFVLSSACS